MLLKIFLVSAAILGISQGGITHGRYERKGGYPAVSPYLIGGTIVPDRYFPSMVSVRRDGTHVCGGVILDEFWILTGAQCIQDSTSSSISVVIGSNRLDSGETHLIEEMKPHEDYDISNSWKNDIALLRVLKPIQLTWGTLPAKLPPKHKTVKPGVLGTIVGWGSQMHGGELSNDLRSIAINIGDPTWCNTTYHKFHLNVFSTQFCDIGSKSIATCDGDYGGPNFVDDEVYGLVSWGKPCGIQGIPTVYTKVPEYIDWITSHMYVA